jgi:hypothetical protein
VIKACTSDRAATGTGTSARNGNLELPVYFLKAKQENTGRKIKKKDKWI